VHAVSVGEVTAAAPIIASLRGQLPDACIVLSTTTETGQEMARQIVTEANAFIFYPLDISFVVRKAIDQVRPDIFVIVETELWPNFIRCCQSHGVKIVMTNGRLSPRSFRKYALTRFFWKGILDAVDEVGVISETDGQRFLSLGAPESRLHVFGNAKYDSLAAKASPSVQEEISLRLNIKPGERVFVAGSTHEGEDAIILGVYGELLKTWPDFNLIIVPRHVERAQAVLSLAREAGFEDTISITEIARGRKRRDERIIVIDAIGELFKAYSLATVVFCGGSIVPKGGQNILEAAAWGKVVDRKSVV
jgi:3-deoxy-D-manno-octulosonic-acid transferase